MNKCLKLKNLLHSDSVTYALEAHNGASALIVEEAGFEVIWGSGLTMSASLAHRDCNELSWTQICEQFEYMANATTIPILVDGDTGFGNFNNARMLVKKLCKYGIAGVCIEDKIFPKTNSFLSHNQLLAPIDEFVGKIAAAKDSQTNPDFCVVARTEAFIAGQGLQMALDRAYAYKEAGADAILVHSKKSTIEEIESFCKHWDHSIPLVIVPTKYAGTPPEVYIRLGISLVIWANHLFRASLSAMRQAAAAIYKEQSVARAEKEMATVEDIFKLVNEEELRLAEGRYLPK